MLQLTSARRDLPDVEIGYSLVRLLGLACLMLLMLLLSAGAALDWLPRKTSGATHVIIGYAGIVLFGVGIWRLTGIVLAPRAPVITISRDGFIDTRTSHGLISWRSVEAISFRQSRVQTVVILKLSPAAAAQVFTTRTARLVAWSNRLLGVDGLMIGTVGLLIEPAELLDLCKTYHAAARGAVRW